MARIGIVIYSLAGAGAERVSVNLAREFSSSGHIVDFILVEGQGAFVEEATAFSELHISDQIGATAWRRAIKNYIKSRSPDVLLAMMEGAGVVSMQAAHNSGVPVFVVSHIHFSKHCRASTRWKERWLMPLAAKWYFPKAAGVIGVSHGVSQDIQSAAGLPPERVHTIYNPIITDEFYRRVSEPVDHPWLFPDRDWLTVVSVGRLTAQKDHETLLRAIAEVNNIKEVRLLIFGRGELEQELVSLSNELGIADLVEFVGFVDNPYRYIAAADVFALSSRWEGFGNVLVEALAAGVNVVSTDCPSGPSEVLEGGKYGTLVKVQAVNELAKAILESRSCVDIMQLQAHLRKFNARDVAASYLSVMELNK